MVHKVEEPVKRRPCEKHCVDSVFDAIDYRV